MRKAIIWTASLWAAIGLAVWLLFRYRESPMLKPFFDWASNSGVAAILSIIGVIGIGLTVFIWKPRQLGKDNSQLFKYKSYSHEQNAQIFRDIHKRTAHLKDLAAKQDIKWEAWVKCHALGLDALKISLPDFEKWKKRRLASLNKKFANKQDIGKEEKIELAKQEIVNHPFPYTERQCKMADCIALGKVLDGMKLGIRRYKDHKYLMLDKKIQKIKAHYSDMKLNEFIDEYLAGSYGLNSYELWVALSYKYDKYDVIDVFSPILAQVDIRNQKIEMDNIMANLLVPVISRIKELDRMDAKNDTTQSQNPPSPT